MATVSWVGGNMNYAWLMAPHEYEPDYDAYINEMYSLEEAMIDVATYDDWFPDLSEKALQTSDSIAA